MRPILRASHAWIDFHGWLPLGPRVPLLPIETPRLRLVPNTPELLVALIDEPGSFREIAGYEPAPGFRDFFTSGDVAREWVESLRQERGADPWRWGFCVVEPESGMAIGSAGFKAPPDSTGVVEIAYAIAASFRGRGYASEAALALVEFASGRPGVRRIRAHTLPEANASTRILGKCGFRHVGPINDPEDGLVWRWERAPSRRSLQGRGSAAGALRESPSLGGGPPIIIAQVDPTGPEARWCLGRYYDELQSRFEDGFDAHLSEVPDPSGFAPPTGAFLVATRGGRPVGCGGLRLTGDGTAYIKRMWVDGSCRGAGLGRRMLRALEETAADMGCRVVQLETNRTLREAIALYRSAGYEEVSPFNDERYADHWFEKRFDSESRAGSSSGSTTT